MRRFIYGDINGSSRHFDVGLESITVSPSDSIHRLDADAALLSLDSRASGLTASEASTRGQEFGPNALARTRGRSAVTHFLAQFTHFFAMILWAAAGLAAFAELREPR